MALRVALVTLLLGVTAAIYLGRPEAAVQPFALFLFGLIALTYLLAVVHAVALRRIDRRLAGAAHLTDVLRRLAAAQIGGDLLVATLLAHATGGAESAFTVFYSLTILWAGVLTSRRGALVTGGAGALLFSAGATLAWAGLLPPLPGQPIAPAETDGRILVQGLVINVGAFSAVALLAGLFGEQVRRAGERLEVERSRVGDLAAQADDVLRSLQSGLVTIDLDGRVLAMNGVAEATLRLAGGAARATELAALVPALAPALAAAAAAGELPRAEIEVAGADGGAPRVLGLSIAPLRDRLGRPIGRIVNLTDLTEVKRLEATVQRAERLATIGELAAGIAHEIRNPLASISGSVELLRGGAGLSAEDRSLMEIVTREVERLDRLISDLLDYARPRAPDLAPTDLAGLAAEAARIFQHDRRYPGVDVRVEGDAELVVEGDPAQLRQVVWNLLVNAAAAMPRGGTVTVQVRARGAGEAELAISDQGAGIAGPERDRVFEPFYSTKARGTGLGLATARRIVEEHGGQITLCDAQPHGLEVRIALPRRHAAVTR